MNLSSIALMVFLIAYAIFEVPSNYFLKKLSPSKWIAFLMFSWGAVTIGLGGAKNFAGVTAVRFILGMFEAGKCRKRRPNFSIYLTSSLRSLSRPSLLPNLLVSHIRALYPCGIYPCIGNSSWGIWWCNCLWSWPYEWNSWAFSLALAVHT